MAGQDEFERFQGEQLLVCALQRFVFLARKTPPRRLDIIAESIQFIHDHLQEPISLEDAAHACSLSLSRFKSLFKEKTGSTPREYINQIKIRRAQQLIREGGSVTETAMALGFATPNYFSVVFRKFTGMTPTEYKKQECDKKDG